MLIKGLVFVGNVGKSDITLPGRQAWELSGKIRILITFLANFIEILERCPLQGEEKML